MKVLILGGCGLMAEATERDLLELDPGDVSKITVADRKPELVKARVEELASSKVCGEVVDIYDHDSLIKLMSNHDIVIHAASSPTTYAAVKAALEARVNIVSLLGINIALAVPGIPHDEFGQTSDAFLAQMDNDYKEAGLIGLMGIGSMPGTSNVLGRYLGDKFDTIESMEFSYVYSFFGEIKTFFPFDPLGVIGQYTQPALVLRDGKFVLLTPRSGREMAQYPEPIGRAERFYISHGEVTDFARHYKEKGIKNIGTKSSWGSEFLSKMDFLNSVGLLDSEPRKVGEVSIVPVEVLLSGVITEKGIETAKKAKTRDYGCTRLEIKGEISGQKMQYTADVLNSPYKNYGVAQHRTGIPAAIAVRMIRRGDITLKGCYPPDYGVDPKIYFKELARREIDFSYTVKYLI